MHNLEKISSLISEEAIKKKTVAMYATQSARRTHFVQNVSIQSEESLARFGSILITFYQHFNYTE